MDANGFTLIESHRHWRRQERLRGSSRHPVPPTLVGLCFNCLTQDHIAAVAHSHHAASTLDAWAIRPGTVSMAARPCAPLSRAGVRRVSAYYVKTATTHVAVQDHIWQVALYGIGHLCTSRLWSTLWLPVTQAKPRRGTCYVASVPAIVALVAPSSSFISTAEASVHQAGIVDCRHPAYC